MVRMPIGVYHWRHLANTTELSACGGDAALCKITTTTCFFLAHPPTFLTLPPPATTTATIHRVQALADISRSRQRNPCTDCKSAICTTRGHPTIFPTYILVRAAVWECGQGHTDTHTDTSGYATWFTAGGAIRIAHYDVIDDVITRKL